MSIISSEIQYRLSGGASNALPTASLGGVVSSTAATTNVFDNVTGAEAAAGDVEYRCVYVRNGNASITLSNAIVWITANTPNAQTTIDIGLGTSAVNATEQTVVDENTAPVGVTFSAAATKGAGISLGDIPAGQTRALWIRRTVSAGAVAAASDTFSIRVEGETV